MCNTRFRDPNSAEDALEKMNGFDLAGRTIQVRLGTDKFTPESSANLLQRFQGQGQPKTGLDARPPLYYALTPFVRRLLRLRVTR